MSLRRPFDTPYDIPLSPLLSLNTAGGLEVAAQPSDKNSASLSLRQILGCCVEKFDSELSPASTMVDGLPFPPSNVKDIHTGLRSQTPSKSEVADSDLDEFYPPPDETSDGDDDDGIARALAFAKMRAAYSGMSAVMINFNLAIRQSYEEEQDNRLSTLAYEVISSISQSPPALERHMSLSSDWSEECDDEDLTEIERDECALVKAYTERWAKNIRLTSTYWQGFNPLHLNVSVSLHHRLIVYKAEQAIKRASDQLDLPAPLEFERPSPSLSRDPFHIGFAGVVESGHLAPRLMSADYSPQTRLEELRLAFNRDFNQDKEVQTVTLRLQAGAKRAAGTQRPKEAETVRSVWESTPSKLRLDITLWLTTEDSALSHSTPPN